MLNFKIDYGDGSPVKQLKSQPLSILTGTSNHYFGLNYTYNSSGADIRKIYFEL